MRNIWILYILTQQDQNSFLSKYYDLAYKCWHEVWLSTLQELDGISKVNSDDFLKQKYISAIFNENDECVGLALFNELNFDRSASRNDSYFNAWDNESIKTLCKDSPHVLVASYVTVNPKYRGQQEGFYVKDIIAELGVLLLKNISNSSVMSGTMRNNRGMNKVAIKTGATLIKSDVSFHGVLVDLVGFYKKDFISGIQTQSILSLSLWKNKKINLDILTNTIYQKDA